MRVLYHSAPPTAKTGYGVHTKHLSTRLNQHHDVSIQSVGGMEGMGIEWEGMDIYPSGAGKFGVQSIPYWFDKIDADVVFSHHDHWSSPDQYAQLQRKGIPMVLYTILDHDLPGKRAPEAVVRANENAFRTVVMSNWALERVRNSRIPDDQTQMIPHGIDTSKYAPVTGRISDAELKRDIGVPEDAFVFGMVAANYGPRKNLPAHIEAFSRLVHDDGLDDVYFYIHAHPTMGGGYNLYEVRDALDLDRDRVIFPDPHEMYHGIDDLTVVQLYNTFDVHMNVTQSESWGLTITEALSCETPVICCNNSAQTEQMGVDHDYFVPQEDGFHAVPHGILVHRGSGLWTQGAHARRFVVDTDDIYAAMRYAYDNYEELARAGERGREYVTSNFDWNDVYADCWRPLFDEVESELDEEYNSFYFDRREAETEGSAFQDEASAILLELEGETVLDAGCGTGTLLGYLRDRHGHEVTGLEYATEGVERTEEKGVECYQGDVQDLQFKDDSFDSVVCQHVLEHVDDDEGALAEMVRVARKKVVCIVPQPAIGGSDEMPDPTEKRRYTEAEVERLVGSTDAETEYREISPGQGIRNWLITVDVPSGGGEVKSVGLSEGLGTSAEGEGGE